MEEWLWGICTQCLFILTHTSAIKAHISTCAYMFACVLYLMCCFKPI